jgi:hypothetical protein
MTEHDDILVLPVPVAVQAVYLVPTSTEPPDPADLVRRHPIATRWTGRLGRLVTGVVGGPHIPVEVRPVSTLPALPPELLAALGATDEQLARLATASHFVLVTAGSTPGWPPSHEWLTRALAVLVAESLGSDVIDVLNYQALTVERAAATLPGADDQVTLADWVFIDYSADRSGYWCTTTGLRRFGLPELQTLATPPNVVEDWGRAMTGVAHRLLGVWTDAISTDREAAFVQLPAALTVSGADVAVAYGRPTPPETESTTATVRLALEPGEYPEQHAFLTIHPPVTWSGSAGEHVAEVCATLFGTPESDIRHAGPSEAMDHAIATARGRLVDIRGRFESGDLDVHTKLLVKYALPADDGRRGTEFLWAYVTSWRDPDRILATSAADAVYHPKVRSGRPVVVDISAVIDWAVEHDEIGIVEGGWTQAALEDE